MYKELISNGLISYEEGGDNVFPELGHYAHYNRREFISS